jgi:hypothetical protein
MDQAIFEGTGTSHLYRSVLPLIFPKDTAVAVRLREIV